jgi:predicted nucleic acid-binding protein
MLVVDASLVAHACLRPDGFDIFRTERLTAPTLLWSEVSSALHEARWRREVSGETAAHALRRLLEAPIEPRSGDELLRSAWHVADERGMARTYDAEYVALARMLSCRLVTVDGRLRRQASRLVTIIGPTEI